MAAAAHQVAAAGDSSKQRGNGRMRLLIIINLKQKTTRFVEIYSIL